MGEYEVGTHLFSSHFYDRHLKMTKDTAGRYSLYLYSQLPFVEIFSLPAFFFNLYKRLVVKGHFPLPKEKGINDLYFL